MVETLLFTEFRLIPIPLPPIMPPIERPLTGELTIQTDLSRFESRPMVVEPMVARQAPG